MNRPFKHTDLTNDEVWLIEQLRALDADSRVLTICFENGQLTHLYIERRTDKNRRITDILKDAEFQDITIKKIRGSVHQIIQRIVRKPN